MTDNASADRWLHQSLLDKDFDGVRSALSEGADPNCYGACTEVSYQRSTSSPAEYVVKKALGKRFLEALLNAGASLGRVPHHPREDGYKNYGNRGLSHELLDVAVQSNNLAAFEVIASHPRFAKEYPRQPSKWQWGLIFDTKKPHLWLTLYQERWGKPEDEQTQLMLLEKSLERADRRCLVQLLDTSRTLSQYLALPEVRKGCINPQGAKMLFAELLPKQPDALEVFNREAGSSLLVSLLSTHKLRPSSLSHWLSLPEITPGLSSVEEQEGLIRACMSAHYKVALIHILREAGVKMPDVQGGESQAEYFARLGFKGTTGMHKPDELLSHAALMNNLWINAQSDTMGNAAPARPSSNMKPRSRL